MLNRDIISAGLPNGLSIEVMDCVDSTNSELKRRSQAGLTEPFLLIANKQYAGRGRQGHSFYSPADSGVYVSLLYPCCLSPEQAASSTSRAAVAVCKAIESLSVLKPEIKWVNDIFVNGKKVCGILTEAITDHGSGQIIGVIVGIGINVTTNSFPTDLPQAGALNMKIDRNRLISAVCRELLALLSDISNYEYMSEYRNRSMVLGACVGFIRDNLLHTGIAEEIDDFCGLHVRESCGKITVLMSGEISVTMQLTTKG